MKRAWKLYSELFFSTLKLSAFTFGGGYVIVPLMRKRFTEELGWIGEEEMLDLISISQSSPGPIAVNASLILGYRMAGLPGALLAAFGTILPPLVTISVISFFYRQFRDNIYVSRVMLGMQSGVAAIICSVVVDMGRSVLKNRKISAVLMAAVFVAVYFFKVNIFIVILACAALGLAAGYAGKKQKTDAAGEGAAFPDGANAAEEGETSEEAPEAKPAAEGMEGRRG